MGVGGVGTGVCDKHPGQVNIECDTKTLVLFHPADADADADAGGWGVEERYAKFLKVFPSICAALLSIESPDRILHPKLAQ